MTRNARWWMIDEDGHVLGCPFTNLSIETQRTDPAVAQPGRQLLGGLKRLLAAYLKEGQDRGEVRRDQGADALLEAFFWMYAGALALSRAMHDQAEYDAFRQRLRALRAPRPPLSGPCDGAFGSLGGPAMMTVRLRLASVLAGWILGERKAAPAFASRLSMRCWLTDCDFNRHMNNSRYLALMDVGRWHFLLVSGLYRVLWQRRWAPVAVRIEIDYKRSLKPGDRFELETFQESVGTRSATLVQRFWRGDQLHAEARVVVLFLHGGKSQPLASLLAELPHLAPAAADPEPAGP